MRKFLALILALTLALSLCACGTEADDTPNVTAKQTEATTEEPEPEPEPPIEVSEFCDPEEMPAPFDGDAPEGYTSDELAITANGTTYTLEWLYNHNIYDWRQAGITYNQIDEAYEEYLDVPFTADAAAALKTKVSDFTMLTMLGTTDGNIYADTPEITVGDETYDIEWLSSHNATEYTEAGIDADTVSQYLDAVKDGFWYTREYRWIETVHDRLVNGW